MTATEIRSADVGAIKFGGNECFGEFCVLKLTMIQTGAI